MKLILIIYLAQYILNVFISTCSQYETEIVHILKKNIFLLVLVLQNLVCFTVTAQVNWNWADFESSVAIYG